MPRVFAVLAVVIAVAPAMASAQPKPARPNVLVMFADDVGIWNLSAYHRGMMGGSTPNLDRIAREGALFTDYYSQKSCTTGRAAFITGQAPLRTGLLKVGLPGARQGLQDKDPTIAELLKLQGYATAQVGKNHLGDRNEYLPTAHGFDEFFGNLYHLNSEEEPEDADYPKDPGFHKKFGPRGMLDCKAATADDATEDPRFGRIGRQTCKDTGPLTRKRMETAEEELLARSLDFIDRSHKTGQPFFLWHNTIRMHVWTRLLRSGRTRRDSVSSPMGWRSSTTSWADCSESWTTSKLPRTRSSCSVATTAQRCSAGRTAACIPRSSIAPTI
jgi:arylsulfatase A-like enzyme